MFEKFLFRSVATLVAVALLATASQAVTIDYVPVGDAGNVNDIHGDGYGGVANPYLIGTYEVTNSQYAQFLNAVADADPNGLYNAEMGGGWNDIGGISRSGALGSYEYAVRENRGNRPVNYVSWYDTLRFSNWLHNGQPTGPQSTSTTEDGAYDMLLGSSVVRKPGARAFLPSEDEWYKAAYYKGDGDNAGYWDYPTQSDTAPTADAPPGADMFNGSANYADSGYVDPTYYTTEVGAYDAKPSDSAYGTFDQGGNLYEWNEADRSGDGSLRGLRGGSWEYSSFSLHALYRGYQFSPTLEYYDMGFRVASVPEPGSITLLICGLVAGLMWWRRGKQ